MQYLLALTMVTLAACQSDETLTGYGDGPTEFVLQSVNAAPVSYRATLSLAEAGEVTGMAPCNSYGGSLTAPYPWFALGPIRATRRACPDLAAESDYFAALSSMTIAEISGDTLILSNEADQQMVFQSTP